MSLQPDSTGAKEDLGIRVFNAEVIPGRYADPLTVVMRGGESNCYGALVLPVEALGSEYYAICAGFEQQGDMSQVR